jgi:hypothetical protein
MLDIGAPQPEAQSVHAVEGAIKVERANVKEARAVLDAAVLEDREQAAESLGHIDYKWYADRYSDWLAEHGATADAVKVQSALHQTLSVRKVLERVLRDIEARRASYEKKRPRK